MATIIGIDLGTTYSAAAHMTADGPRLIPNALGENLTPSVVGIDLDGNLVVGRAARELQVLHPDRCAAVFKRRMGSEWTATLVDRAFTPVELSSLVLASLKRDAEHALGQAIDSAVVTVPAYFNEKQRRATIEAGRLAGLTVDRIINEPTAAAIAYGLHDGKEDRVVLVFDLGGGTFDVSLVAMFEGVVEVRASSGDTFLGGEDFTASLASRILEKRGYLLETAELQFPKLASRLLQQCELAKRRLSFVSQTEIRFPNVEGELSDDGDLIAATREQFDNWTRHILARTELPIRRVLEDAKITSADLDGVLLVGGATRMPAVKSWLVERFGMEPQQRLNPDEVVALGAAVQAGLLAGSAALDDLVVTDISPFTLGIETCKTLGGEERDGYFLPIIHRNTPIPTSRVKRVQTLHPNQSTIKLAIYQGEHRRVEKNVLLGEFSVTGIPKGPRGQRVDVRFTYDLNGVLEVEATIVDTRKAFSHVIARHANELSEQQIAEAVAAMQSLKTDPREEAPNRFLLRRAERVYGELGLDAQRELAGLLDGFEAVLHENDRSAILRYRELLADFLDKHDLDPTEGTSDGELA